MDDGVTRLAPGAANRDGAVVEGWALTPHPVALAPVAGDVLLLPGMAGAVWSWAPDLLDRFAQRGLRCWSLRFSGRRGGASLAHDPGKLDRILAQFLADGDARAALDAMHGALPGAAAVDGPDLDTFARQTEDAIRQIGRPVLVIGHSLGGAVAQAVLRRGRVVPRATALLCSVPPYGLWRAAMQMSLLNPPLWQALLALGFGAAHAGHMETLGTNLFPDSDSPTDARRLFAGLNDESLRAVLHSQGWPPFAPPPGPRRDVAVFGTSRDRLVPLPDLYATAAWYGTVPRVIHRAGHLPMLGAAAEDTAAALLAWCSDWAA